MENKHGGKRKGAGRKEQYPGGTVVMRIPIALEKEIRKMITDFKKSFAKSPNL